MLALTHVCVNQGSLEMEPSVQISTNVMAVRVIIMQHAPIWLDHIHVHATMDILAMEHTVKILMNAVYHHRPVTQMQLAPTLLDHTFVHANLVTLEMELIVMVIKLNRNLIK